MTNSSDHRDFCRLVSHVLDHTETDEEWELLKSLLHTNRDVRQLYYQMIALHTQIVWRFGEAGAENETKGHSIRSEVGKSTKLQTPLMIKIAAGQDRINSSIWSHCSGIVRSLIGHSLTSSLVVAIVFYGGVGLLVWSMSQHHSLEQYAGVENGSNLMQPFLAQITESTECVWEPGGGPSDITDSVTPIRRYRLAKGTAEIELQQGAQVVLEGPAIFHVESGNAGYLERGKLFAQVPRRAIGFTVTTPMAEVVDLGTEFGVEVSSTGETVVQVFQGKVDVEPHHDAYIAIDQHQAQGRQRLVAGQSSVIASTLEGIHSGPTAAFRDFLRRVQAEKGTAANDKELVIASDVESGAIGNQGDLDGKVVGMDFDVLEPIEIQRLGVFDSGSDGIDPSSQLIVGIWSRDMLGTPADPSDDQPGKRLARQKFSAESPGQLIGGNRFKPLESPLRLEHGTYSVIAWGFNRANLSARLLVGSEGETLSDLPDDIPPTPRASLQESWIGIVGPLPVFGASDSSHYWNRTATQLINGATAGNGMVGRRLEMANSDGNRMWHTEGTAENVVVFDLTGESGVKQHIAIAKIWNYHEQEGAAWLTTSCGVKEVTIQHSLDGNTWLNVINPATNTRLFQLTKAPDEAEYGEDLADVLSLGAGGIDTRYVRIKIESKLDSKSSYLGLSEVRFFDGNPVTRRWVLNDGSGRLLFLPGARIFPLRAEFPLSITVRSQSSRFLTGTFEFSAAAKPATDVRRASQDNSP